MDKRTVRRIVATALAVILAEQVFFLICGFGLPVQFGDTFMGELKSKYERLKETSGKRIVLVGGSGVAFDCDSALMDDFFPSYEIVNFGMYAGLGTKAVMDLSENYIHEGDIVILSPEQSEQTFSDYFNGEYMWQAADGAFGMLRDLKSENFEAMLGNFPRFALEKLNYVMKGQKPQTDSIYQKKSFNTYGDIELDTCRENILPNGYDVNQKVRFTEDVVQPEFMDYMNDWAKRLEKKEQVILLLNRRGYSSFVTCKNCGYTFKCPNCDITLTYHKSSNTLRCHYCGYGEKVYSKCPSCSEDSLTSLGIGTQRIEEVLNNEFSSARVLRMDYDTTSRKGMHEKMIEDFKEQKYDILLGTQMVAKGLDFSNVTLVGVINADTSLNIPDFRSSENTYSLLSQVAGRSGRSSKDGSVIIQTYNPKHYAISLTKYNDYLKFYNEEMKIRKILKYPPYYYLCNIRISGKDASYILDEALKIKRSLERNLHNFIILGPSTSSLFRINNIFRYNIILKYKRNDGLYEILTKIIEHYKSNSKIKIDVDFNPSQML